MPFEQTCSSALDYIAYYTEWAAQKAGAVSFWKDFAADHWDAGEDHLAIEDIILSLTHVVEGLRYSSLSVSPFFPEGAIWWYFTNCITGYTLTMDDILSVMLSATDDEYKKFIGLVDAYRVGLWNKPFNSEYYAALARGFAQWG